MGTIPDGDHVDVASDERAQRLRHTGFDLETDDGAAPAPLERALVEANEVFRLLLDFDVAVANDAKRPLAQDFVARKQEPDERDDQPVQHHEARRAPERTVGQSDEAVDASGNAHQRAHRLAVARIEEFERQRESQIGDERKRMRRIDRERRQNREHLREEIVLQPLPLATGQIADLEDHDAVGGEFGLQRLPARLLRGDQCGDALADAFELLGGRAPVIGNFGDPGEHLADQAGDADHEKFVEIGGRDGEEPQPLEQRMAGLAASSSTLRLNSSHDNSRLMNRSGDDNNGGGSSFAAIVAVEEWLLLVATAGAKQISFSVRRNIDPIAPRRKHGEAVCLTAGPRPSGGAVRGCAGTAGMQR